MKKPNFDYLMIAIVQSQDADNAQEALDELGFSVNRLPSVGGFLGRQNITFLIALPQVQQHLALGALRENCSRRVEYLATPLESAPFPLPTPTPVTVGGAIVFGFEIEDYEEV